jgi:natural product biosynthesis luciferase-like monooxygenase protein
MEFGIMFFSSVAGLPGRGRYQLLIDSAKLADERGFSAVWTPERHFHEFGGIFPNPAVIGAALSMVTERIQIRAGSLISPLHQTLRIAEEWSAVDNLSNGRVAISFGSGWNVDDFVLFPERYPERQAVMYEQIETLKALWRGGSARATNSFGAEIEVAVHPRPVQRELPVWVTSSGNAKTFASAGAIGANVLTHMIGQDLPTLAAKIQVYRRALEEAGFDPRHGKVSLMLHTFLGHDMDEVLERVRHPFREYLRSAISLEEKAAIGGGVISGGHRIDPHQISARMMDDLLDATFERYVHTASLIGTPARCETFVGQLLDIGIDEIACLVDFGVPADAVLESLKLVDALRASLSSEALQRAAEESVLEFMEELDA